jgi:hypothetical protein
LNTSAKLITANEGQKFKADAGKLRVGLVFEGMPRSLLMLAAVLSYGAQKYEAHSWKKVAGERYVDAKFRHLLDPLANLGDFDDESGLLHEAHELCNSMFIFEQKLEALSPEEFRSLLKFNKPPQDHKTAHKETKIV